jgi:5-formyltetrahydrofolate cyclo-ligase
MSKWSELHVGIMDNSDDEKTAGKESPSQGPDRTTPEYARPAGAGPDMLQDVMRIWLVGRPETVIGAYWPIKGEFDPLPALHRWKEDGELIDQPQPRRIGLPVVDKVHKTMVSCLVPGLPHGGRCLRHPQTQGHRGDRAHAAVRACVGYGPGGYRLGYGGGFYDRTLATLQPKPYTVGLGFDGGYPYRNLMRRSAYEETKFHLQVELLKLQAWVKESGQRVVILFEGRDAAGKGGAIKRFMEHLNPRGARVVALEKPSEVERGQWYFQRYVQHLPTKGEIVMMDRSVVQPRRGRTGDGLLQ